MSRVKGIWECKIGVLGEIQLRSGADGPMRDAVRETFIRLTGVEPEFIFSGWNAELGETELAVVEDRDPVFKQPDPGYLCGHCGTEFDVGRCPTCHPESVIVERARVEKMKG